MVTIAIDYFELLEIERDLKPHAFVLAKSSVPEVRRLTRKFDALREEVGLVLNEVEWTVEEVVWRDDQEKEGL